MLEIERKTTRITAVLVSCCLTAAADVPLHRDVAPPRDSSGPAAGEAPPAGPVVEPLAVTSGSREAKIVARAREEVSRAVAYDPAYHRLSYSDERETGHRVYPGGDLDPHRGVCTDVVVRALRAVGLDLQEQVHADILARPRAYRTVSAPDANIDHRRVGPLLTYFRAHAAVPERDDWRPGDVVVWAFHPCPACNPDHIGIVSDRIGPRGLPLMIHNVGPKPSEDDVIDAWTVLGHFRP